MEAHGRPSCQASASVADERNHRHRAARSDERAWSERARQQGARRGKRERGPDGRKSEENCTVETVLVTRLDTPLRPLSRSGNWTPTYPLERETQPIFETSTPQAHVRRARVTPELGPATKLPTLSRGVAS